MVVVKPRKNESFEGMLKRFKKAWNDSGIAYELFDRQHFIKPSLRKKIKKRKPWGK